MVWAVSLSTTKLSPRRLTQTRALLAFAVWLGVVTSTWPLAHPALYLQQSLRLAAPQCISGRTSYLHVRLAFHPYPQVIPQFCNTGGCAPRRLFTAASRCPWIAHVVSGPFIATAPLAGVALFRLGFPLAPLLYRRLAPATMNLSPDHSTKGTPSALGGTLPQWPLTACKYEVSGSLSSPSRGAFHLSLTVLVHYRSLKVLSLGGWSPLLPTNSPGFVVLRIPAVPPVASSTGLSPAAGARSNAFEYNTQALLPVLQPQRFRKTAGLGSSRLARHYDGNLG